MTDQGSQKRGAFGLPKGFLSTKPNVLSRESMKSKEDLKNMKGEGNFMKGEEDMKDKQEDKKDEQIHLTAKTNPNRQVEEGDPEPSQGPIDIVDLDGNARELKGFWAIKDGEYTYLSAEDVYAAAKQCQREGRPLTVDAGKIMMLTPGEDVSGDISASSTDQDNPVDHSLVEERLRSGGAKKDSYFCFSHPRPDFGGRAGRSEGVKERPCLCQRERGARGGGRERTE
jgi:hypothetical protein